MTLINQPEPCLFQDPEVAKAVRESLGEGFTLYNIAVARCQQILGNIVKDISGLMSDSQVRHITGAHF